MASNNSTINDNKPINHLAEHCPNDSMEYFYERHNWYQPKPSQNPSSTINSLHSLRESLNNNSDSVKQISDMTELPEAIHTAINIRNDNVSLLNKYIVQSKNITLLSNIIPIMDNQPIVLAFVGQINSGKSSLVSTILDNEIELPVQEKHETFQITRLVYSSRRYISELTSFNEGQMSGKIDYVDRFDSEKLREYIQKPTILTHNKYLSISKIVEIGLPSDILRAGLVILDFPGINNTESQDLSRMIWKLNTNIVCYIYDYNQGFSMKDAEYLDEIECKSYDKNYNSVRNDCYRSMEYILIVNKIGSLPVMINERKIKQKCLFSKTNSHDSIQHNFDKDRLLPLIQLSKYKIMEDGELSIDKSDYLRDCIKLCNTVLKKITQQYKLYIADNVQLKSLVIEEDLINVIKIGCSKPENILFVQGSRATIYGLKYRDEDIHVTVWKNYLNESFMPSFISRIERVNSIIYCEENVDIVYLYMVVKEMPHQKLVEKVCTTEYLEQMVLHLRDGSKSSLNSYLNMPIYPNPQILFINEDGRLLVNLTTMEHQNPKVKNQVQSRNYNDCYFPHIFLKNLSQILSLMITKLEKKEQYKLNYLNFLLHHEYPHERDERNILDKIIECNQWMSNRLQTSIPNTELAVDLASPQLIDFINKKENIQFQLHFSCNYIVYGMMYENENIQVTVIHHLDSFTLQKMKIRIREERPYHRHSWSVYDDMESNTIYLIYREFPHKRLIESAVSELTKNEILDYIKQILRMILSSSCLPADDTNMDNLETLIDQIVPDINYPIRSRDQLIGEPKAKIAKRDYRDRPIGLLNFRPDNVYVDEYGKIFINQCVPNDSEISFITARNQRMNPSHFQRKLQPCTQNETFKLEIRLELMYTETLSSLYWLLKFLTECDKDLIKLHNENRDKMLGDRLTKEEKRIENLTERFEDKKTVFLLKKLIDYCRYRVS